MKTIRAIVFAVLGVLMLALSPALAPMPAAAQTTGAIFTVNSTGDEADASPGDGKCRAAPGQCTLRAAIMEANAHPGLDTITFRIQPAGVHTISPASALPAITDPVVIDGTTQPGFAGSPIIELSGANAGTAASGLTITAGNSTVRGLVINRFGSAPFPPNPSQNGILLSGNGGNVIQGNFIGTDVTGILFRAGTSSPFTFFVNGTGVRIDGSPNNTIGGTTAGAGNVITGDFFAFGVLVTGGGATGNRIRGNFIGADRSGTVGLSGGIGVRIDGAPNNTIGGTVPGAGNLISGGNGSGVEIFGTGATGNVVQGNLIGTNGAGTAGLCCSDDGVFLDGGASGNTIGGATPGSRNIISGNGGIGVVIEDSSGNLLQGNFIGTDPSGTAFVLDPFGGNQLTGVVIRRSSNNTIGGTTAGSRNIISGNFRGVNISGTGATGNLVQGNFIGTDVTGSAALGNSTEGVFVGFGALANIIGGTAPGARNVISGNRKAGVSVGGDNNLIQGNFIGTDVTGTAALGNGDGVDLGGKGILVGGTILEARNIISGNRGRGVRIAGATESLVQGNFIGTDVTGKFALGNLLHGVHIGASGNIIGGAAPGARNVISGNQGAGVSIQGNANLVQGNLIGTDVTGAALGNLQQGVAIGEVFSGPVNDNIVGGAATGAGNVIAFNGREGVRVSKTISTVDSLSPPSTGNVISSNGIFSNGALGIDLDGDGVTANDAADPDTGSNNLQNFPVLTSAASAGGNTVVEGTLNSSPNTTFRLEFFASAACDPSGFGEGERLLGSTAVTTRGVEASFTVSFPTVVPAGQSVTATATDPGGNTSEFSACRAVP